MANKAAFKKSLAKKTEIKNHAGALAYSKGAEVSLAQLAVTGCFNNTYYVTAEQQLDQVLTLARQTSPEFVAKIAVYAHETGFMKDMPAALMAWLFTVDTALCEKVFSRVIDNGKMLRNFVQMIRSGAFGRHNVSSSAKRLIQKWFDSRRDDQIFFQSIGSSPTFGDILKMARIRPNSLSRSALFAYLVGRKTCKYDGVEHELAGNLPEIVSAYEGYRRNPKGPLPSAPFEMLTGLELDTEGWTQVAVKASWTQTLKNLNTFSRHGVLKNPEMVQLISNRLRSPELIQKARVFPYQILMAYKETTGVEARSSWARPSTPVEESDKLPNLIVNALEAALEVATLNVPSFSGKQIVLCPDVSGSMSSCSITGSRKGSTSKVRPIDVAALVAASLLRNNPFASVLPFEGHVCNVKLDPKKTVIENAQILSKIGGGSTDCAAPLATLNRARSKTDVVIFISDNESWSGYHSYSRGTQMSEQWEILRKRNPDAKLVCIDITPNETTQVQDRDGVLNVGGFSDSVFKIMDAFISGSGKDHWVNVIKDVQL